ncbi:hypothetical protein BC830DRAFT_1113390 [Chytriomyces sp. MP71]|nr:hypothetical protein BC830DRAFT_1113390 [Chytriomyces sp. MP71]
MSVTGIPLTALIYGLCIEASFKAILSSAPSLVQKLQQKEPVFLISSILLCNLFALINFCLFLVNSVPEKANCETGNLFSTLSYHSFMLVFDAFILYKTYGITRWNKLFFCLALLVWLNRLGWSVADSVLSFALFDVNKHICTFNENPVSSVGYHTADLICDILATIASIYMMLLNRGNLIKDSNNLFVALGKQNMLRSCCVLLVYLIVTYISSSNFSFDVLRTTWAAQDYVFVNLINVELYYKESRAFKPPVPHSAGGNESINTPAINAVVSGGAQSLWSQRVRPFKVPENSQTCRSSIVV